MSQLWWVPFPILLALAAFLLAWLIRRSNDDNDRWPPC